MAVQGSPAYYVFMAPNFYGSPVVFMGSTFYGSPGLFIDSTFYPVVFSPAGQESSSSSSSWILLFMGLQMSSWVPIFMAVQ